VPARSTAAPFAAEHAEYPKASPKNGRNRCRLVRVDEGLIYAARDEVLLRLRIPKTHRAAENGGGVETMILAPEVVRGQIKAKKLDRNANGCGKPPPGFFFFTARFDLQQWIDNRKPRGPKYQVRQTQ